MATGGGSAGNKGWGDGGAKHDTLVLLDPPGRAHPRVKSVWLHSFVCHRCGELGNHTCVWTEASGGEVEDRVWLHTGVRGLMRIPPHWPGPQTKNPSHRREDRLWGSSSIHPSGLTDGSVGFRGRWVVQEASPRSR